MYNVKPSSESGESMLTWTEARSRNDTNRKLPNSTGKYSKPELKDGPNLPSCQSEKKQQNQRWKRKWRDLEARRIPVTLQRRTGTTEQQLLQEFLQRSLPWAQWQYSWARIGRPTMKEWKRRSNYIKIPCIYRMSFFFPLVQFYRLPRKKVCPSCRSGRRGSRKPEIFDIQSFANQV